MDETAFPIIGGDDDEIDDSSKANKKSSKKGFQAMGLSKGIFGALMRIGLCAHTNSETCDTGSSEWRRRRRDGANGIR